MFSSKKGSKKYAALDSNGETELTPPSTFAIDSDSDEDNISKSPPPTLSSFPHSPPSSFPHQLYNTLTFSFLKPLLDLGNSKVQLDPYDLPDLKVDNCSEEILRKYKKALSTLRSPKKTTLPLSKILLTAFGPPFFRAGFLKLIHDLCAFIGPNVLKHLILFLKDPEARLSTGIGLTLLVTLSQLTMSLCLRQYFYICYQTGLRLRSSVILSVYNKSLKLSTSERAERSTGEITNLMSVDAQRLQDLTPYLHAVWYSFLQIFLALFFLYRELGASCFAGVAIIVVMMPVTKKVGKVLGGMSKRLMKVKDERLKMNNEVLSGVKVIKQMAWEKSFENKILELRNSEINQLKKYVIFQSLSGTLWSTVPLLVAVSTFTAYVASGKTLDVATALTSLALFEILRFPLFMLPNVINNLVEAKVSVDRIRVFLEGRERGGGGGGEEGEGVKVEGATFVWDGKRVDPTEGGESSSNGDEEKKEEKVLSEEEWENLLLKSQLSDAEHQIQTLKGNPSNPDPKLSSLLSLRRIHLHAPPGSLIAVVGPVGSGKSTLLNGILGECRSLTGSVSLPSHVSYVSQKSFIMNDTLRNNITFSKPYDPERYQDAIYKCALTHDLTVLPSGDQTEIGEKGINLSGGQKARVALARAVYHDADVVLLDDPLSAVDAHVGKHIFKECIVNGLLAKGDKSVILVTNALQFLNSDKVSKIIVLENGAVKEEGKYNELMNNVGGTFSTMLNNYRDKSAESMGSRSNSKLDLVGVGGELEGEEPEAVEKSEKRNEEELKKEGKIITSELKERETGSVTKDVYLLWARALGGYHTAIMILLSYIGVEMLNVSARWWLSYWSEHGDSENSNQGQFLGVYAGINAIIVISMFVRQLHLYLKSLRAAKTLFNELLTTILRAPMSFFDTTPLGRILNRFSKDTYTLDQQMSATVRMYLGTLSSVIGTLIVISTVTPWFLITLPPILIFYLGKQKYFTKTYRELKRLDSVSRSPIYALFGETLEGVATIRAFKAQSVLKKRIMRLLDENQKAFWLTFSAQCWLAVRLELAGTAIITFACLCAVLQHGSQAGNETFAGAAGLSISFALSVTQSLNWSVRMSSDLEAQMVSVERINQYVRDVKPEAPRDTPMDENLPRDFPKGEIVFENAKLRYRPGLPLVLKGLSLTIPAGSKVGVVGRTGAGKSTLMIALLRLVELAEGKINIDGVDCSKLGLHLLRSKLAIVPQDPVLFSGSIRSNLDPFESFADSRLVEILVRVGLMGGGGGERINGLDDQVEEDGSNFSVGQRQLIVIARALLSDCSIVLMDEATAAIDVDTDEKIQQAMRTEFKSATTITVAHRLNTIMDSTHILVMDDGRMKEFDSPAALLAKEGGSFRELVDAFESSHLA
ncbi:hypothetical protein TrLO_g747 [Triparma laevis f. longispina]|uniref:Uncharacterized protein n=1 Tax=Triparma laevis f. longispina TaxID=1714387 RepID=A0A9W7C090_9STRA|nr:hypothetical protein TrLO_g747 [Triparma laevis f. longispina]